MKSGNFHGIRKKPLSESSSLPPSLQRRLQFVGYGIDTLPHVLLFCKDHLSCIEINCSNMGKNKKNRTKESGKQADKAVKHAR